MTAISYNSIGAGQFTDKLLDTNFMVISEYTKQVEDFLYQMAQTVEGLSRNQLELAKKMPKKRRVLPILVGAGVGIYVYKRLKKSGLSVEFDAQTGSLRAQKPAETTPKETN